MSDLDDTGTWTTVTADVSVGDLFTGVAFLDLDREFALALTPDDQPLAPVLFSLGVVVAAFAHYVVVAPASTADDVQDKAAFARLAEIARGSSDYVRLPAIPGVWAADAIALVFRPQTLTRSFLGQEPAQRLASMTDAARSTFLERLRGTR